MPRSDAPIPMPKDYNPIASLSATPSRSASRKTSHFSTPQSLSSFTTPSPEAMSMIINGDVHVSSLDPRHFTPTLHANLVSEILSLRREVDSKGRLIVGLEEQLSGAEHENEELTTLVSFTKQEVRDVRRQLQALEGGSDSAMERLIAERDAAAGSADDLKRRLEAVQRKLKTRENDSARINTLWESDKQRWDTQRRTFDRQLHVADSRVRMLTAELERTHNSDVGDRGSSLIIDDRQLSISLERQSSGTSRRRNSIARKRDCSADRQDERGRSSPGTPRHSLAREVQSLADELDLDSDDESSEGYRSDDALPEESIGRLRTFSSQSARESAKARKVLGLYSVEKDGLLCLEDPKFAVIPSTEGLSTSKAVTYRDQTTQWSLPSSPDMSPQILDTITEASSFQERGYMRPSSRLSLITQHETLSSMVSEACQTDQSLLTSVVSINLEPALTSTASTQTEPWALKPAVPTTSLRTPSILESSVHSVSNQQFQSSPYENTTSRVSLYVHTAVQTEPATQISSHDSLIVSVRQSPERSKAYENHAVRSSLYIYDPVLSLTSEPELNASIDSTPETRGHDSRLLTDERIEHREQEFDELLPDSTWAADREGTGLPREECSINQKVVRKTLRKTESGQKSITLNSQQEPLSTRLLLPPVRPPPLPPMEHEIGAFLTAHEPNNDIDETQVLPEIESSEPEPGRGASLIQATSESVQRKSSRFGKGRDFEGAAVVASGTTLHPQRSRSPSAPTPIANSELFLEPPFPVPDRSSSKRLLYDTDSTSPTLSSAISAVNVNRGTQRSRMYRHRGVYKTRSKSTSRSVEGLHSSSLFYGSSVPESPKISDMTGVEEDTTKNIARKPRIISGFENREKELLLTEPLSLSSHILSHGRGSPAIASVHGPTASATNVVDAVSQTMVGEWLWKYVRRRKSFGLPESAAAEFEHGKSSDSSAARHQRWVWLAPYERAVMWSSKQPTSGSALMGKTGRKLVIQSVLDVRDETPLPKSAGHSGFFGRSILILTAQRALKFTTTSKDRHFIWLTALSFLSHSSVVPQPFPSPSQLLTNNPSSLPAPSLDTLNKRTSSTSLQRTRLHDSIKVTKENDNVNMPSLPDMTETTLPNTHLVLKGACAYDEEIGAENADSGDDAAEPPLVPRFASQPRRRDGTGPKNLRYRRLRASNNPYANGSKQYAQAILTGDDRVSVNTHASGWLTDGGGSIRNSFWHGIRRSTAAYRDTPLINGMNTGGKDPESFRQEHETHKATAINRPVSRNFFEAVGTVRMEAFVRGLDKAEMSDPAFSLDHQVRVASARHLRSRSRSLDRYPSLERDRYQNTPSRSPSRSNVPS